MSGPLDGRAFGAGLGFGVVGLGLALGVGASTDPELGRQIVGYAIGTLPLTAGLGAWIGRRSRAPVLGSPVVAAAGALASVVAALLVANLLAAVRFRQLGSDGGLSMAAAPYARESLMVLGVLPAVAAFGWMATRWRGLRAPVLRAALGGGGAALLAGPAVLLSGALARLPAGPLVLALVLAAVVALVPRPGGG